MTVSLPLLLVLIAAALAVIVALVVVWRWRGGNLVDVARRVINWKLRRAGLRERTVTLAAAGTECDIRFWEGGVGSETVLLVHGFGADAVWQWHGQVPALTPRYRVVMPDLLWFGGTTSREARYDLEDQVAVLLALLDHLGEGPVHVVGLSYGGLVAHELALHHPERVARLALLDSPGPIYGPQDYEALCARFSVDDVADFLVASDRDGIRTLTGLAFVRPPWTPGFAVDDVLKTLYAQHGEEQRALLGSLRRRAETGAPLPTPIPHETLIVWGADDPIFPLELGERLADHLGERSQLVVVRPGRHAPNVEFPGRVNGPLLHHLERGLSETPSPDASHQGGQGAPPPLPGASAPRDA